MAKTQLAFADTDSLILMAITCEQPVGGADVAMIRNNVDGIERMGLSDGQLSGALHRLQAAGYVRRTGDRYALNGPLDEMVPRTAKGNLTFQRRHWNPLFRKLGLSPL